MMKKLLILPFLIMTSQVYAMGSKSEISVENYTNLGYTIIIRYGEENEDIKNLSGKKTSATQDEHTCIRFRGLDQGPYFITVEREAAGILAFLRLVQQDPRLLIKDTAKDARKVGREKLSWNINVGQNSRICITLKDDTTGVVEQEKKQRYVIAALVNEKKQFKNS